MTAFHLVLILLILYIFILFIYYKKDFINDGQEFWFALWFSLLTEVLICMICMLIYGIGSILCNIDWYGFFHDKII